MTSGAWPAMSGSSCSRFCLNWLEKFYPVSTFKTLPFFAIGTLAKKAWTALECIFSILALGDGITNGTVHFKKYKQWFEYQHLLFLRDFGWPKFFSIFNCCSFLTPVLVIHLWYLRTVVFLHWCPICAVLLQSNLKNTERVIWKKF